LLSSNAKRQQKGGKTSRGTTKRKRKGPAEAGSRRKDGGLDVIDQGLSGTINPIMRKRWTSREKRPNKTDV